MLLVGLDAFQLMQQSVKFPTFTVTGPWNLSLFIHDVYSMDFSLWG